MYIMNIAKKKIISVRASVKGVIWFIRVSRLFVHPLPQQ